MEEYLKNLAQAIVDGEEEDAVEACQALLDGGMDPMDVLKGAQVGMDEVSELYNAGEAYLPELVLAGDAMAAVTTLLFSSMSAEQAAQNKKGTIVMGQAKGDVHDIGKNITAALLAVNGFEVHDLGTDVSPKQLIEEAQRVKADIILCGTLLTTSLPYLADAKQYIIDTGNGDKIFYGVGGGPVTPEFAAERGVDGWSRTAFDCVNMCMELIKRGGPGTQPTLIVNSEEA